jgi:hypothetical protein
MYIIIKKSKLLFPSYLLYDAIKLMPRITVGIHCSSAALPNFVLIEPTRTELHASEKNCGRKIKINVAG